MRRGRPPVPASPGGVTPALRAPIALSLAVLLAGCPALETPVASIGGSIVGARAGAFAYPLGRPDLKVEATDAPAGGIFTFRIDGVPIGTRALVLYDGVARAELAEVELDGGDEDELVARYGEDAVLSPSEEGARMPLAAVVVAVAMPDGGASAAGTAIAVADTDLGGTEPLVASMGVPLQPLPAGRFELTARLPGFAPAAIQVDVPAGASVPVALRLAIDGDAEAPGCGASLECENELRCNDEDGRCYACREADDCGIGELCAPSTGLCQTASGPADRICMACSSDAGCASGICVLEGGESEGYCSRACAAPEDCPAGFACDGTRCAAPDGCDDWMRTMGAPCVVDDDCQKELAGGWCAHLPGLPGACTAACAVDDDCRIGTLASLVCAAGSCAAP